MAGLLEGLFNFDKTTPRPNRLSTLGATLTDVGAALNGGRGGALQANRDRFAEEQEAALKAQQRSQLAQYADSLGLSPKEKLLFMVNPQAFGNLIRDQEAPYTLGRQRFQGGNMVAEAPEYQAFGDQYLKLSSAGVDPVFTRGPTISEGLEERGLQERIQARLIDDQIKRGQLGVSQGNLGLARERLGFDRSKEGGGGSGAKPWERKW